MALLAELPASDAIPLKTARNRFSSEMVRNTQKYSDLLTRLKIMQKLFDENKGRKKMEFIIAPVTPNGCA